MESTKYNSRIALITGASSGIGQAIAKDLANLGMPLILMARRKERLEQLASELTVPTLLLVVDVRKSEEVFTALNNLPDSWKKIEILINNAGLASGLDPIHQGSLEDWEAMIDTNVKGLLYVTRAISPGMVERKKGHIINVGSIAGIEPYPNGNVYNASKFAVDALSRGMRMDLLAHNILVSQVLPGMVETEFSKVRFHGNEEKAELVYRGLQPLQAEDISRTVVFMLTQPEHVCIQDVLVMPRAQASATQVIRS